MKNSVLIILTTLITTSALAADEPLKPTWVYPDRPSGTTTEGYEYTAKSPFEATVQIKKNEMTGKTESATGNFGFDGDAAQLFFEKMEKPVHKEIRVETDPKMAGTHEFRAGKSYSCVKRAWSNGRIDYQCYFNFSDVSTGALRRPNTVTKNP